MTSFSVFRHHLHCSSSASNALLTWRTHSVRAI